MTASFRILKCTDENQTKINLWLNYLLVAYAFLLPINDYARAFLVSLMLILILVRGNYKYYFLPAFQNRVVLSFLALLGIYALSIVWSQNTPEAVELLKEVKYVWYLPLFLSFIDKRFALSIVSGFLGGVFFSELISYGIHFEIVPPRLVLDGIELYRSNINDPCPFLNHSHYGFALALGVALLLYRLIIEKISWGYKIAGSLFILTMTMNIAITGGRIGYLLYGILIIMTLYFAYGKKMFRPLIGGILWLTLAGSIAYQMGTLFTQRVDATVDTIASLIEDPTNFDSTFGRRLGMWYYSIDVIKTHPFLGVGIGDGLETVKQNIDEKYPYLMELVHFHNQYIEILVGTGIIGLIIFLNIFFQIFRFKYSDRELKAITFLVTTALGIALLTETFHVKFYLAMWVLFLAVGMSKIGLINAALYDENKRHELKIYSSVIVIALIVGKLQ